MAATGVLDTRSRATASALDPFEVSIVTRDGYDTVVVRRATVDLDDATRMTGLTRAQLLRMLRFRRQVVDSGRKPKPYHIPPTLSGPDEDPRWERPVFVTWALRMGLYVQGHRGLPVIGYTGMALLVDQPEQTLRNARLNGGGDLPRIVLEIVRESMTVVLFDFHESVRWCLRTERISPDVAADQLLRTKIIRG